MINYLESSDIVDKRSDPRLMLFYEIVNHVVSFPSESIILSTLENWGTRKSHAHNKFMHI